MADVSEYFSDTAQEISEANDVQIIASNKRKCYVESSTTDTHSELVNKRSQQKLTLSKIKKLSKFTIKKISSFVRFTG